MPSIGRMWWASEADQLKCSAGCSCVAWRPCSCPGSMSSTCCRGRGSGWRAPRRASWACLSLLMILKLAGVHQRGRLALASSPPPPPPPPPPTTHTERSPGGHHGHGSPCQFEASRCASVQQVGICVSLWHTVGHDLHPLPDERFS